MKLTDPVGMILNSFLLGLSTLVTASDSSYLFTHPIFMMILVTLGFVVGTAIGSSGIGGATLIVPSLIFLGVSPQAMVGASLFFNFFSNILGTALYIKKGNISWRAFIYIMITVIPSIFLASWIWMYIGSNFGSKALDLFILLPIGTLLAVIGGFMIRNHISKKKNSLTQEDQKMELRTNFSTSDKGTLMGMGGLVTFIIQISSVGAGAILVPVLLRVVRSPKHVAGTSVTFGLVVSFMGAMLHYTFGNVPIILVAFLLVGSVPGILLGVRIASTTSPRKLSLIFAILILASGVLVLNRGIAHIFD